MPARSTRPHGIKVFAKLSSESEEKRRSRGVEERACRSAACVPTE